MDVAKQGKTCIGARATQARSESVRSLSSTSASPGTCVGTLLTHARAVAELHEVQLACKHRPALRCRHQLVLRLPS